MDTLLPIKYNFRSKIPTTNFVLQVCALCNVHAWRMSIKVTIFKINLHKPSFTSKNTPPPKKNKSEIWNCYWFILSPKNRTVLFDLGQGRIKLFLFFWVSLQFWQILKTVLEPKTSQNLFQLSIWTCLSWSLFYASARIWNRCLGGLQYLKYTQFVFICTLFPMLLC